jgi:hypothetical protein
MKKIIAFRMPKATVSKPAVIPVASGIALNIEYISPLLFQDTGIHMV